MKTYKQTVERLGSDRMDKYYNGDNSYWLIDGSYHIAWIYGVTTSELHADVEKSFKAQKLEYAKTQHAKHGS